MMVVKCFTNNPFQENTYLLFDPQTKECLLIDPGMCNSREWKIVKDFVEQEGLIPQKVLLTHCHVDHIMGTGFLKDTYNVSICGPQEDESLLPPPGLQGQMFGVHCTNEIASIDENVFEGSCVQIGDSSILVIDVPGHSFHGLCYFLPKEKLLFSGDVLFFCSIGRSDFGTNMGCDGESLVQGIQNKLLSLPCETIVFPGHGPQTSIGREIQNNPFF